MSCSNERRARPREGRRGCRPLRSSAFRPAVSSPGRSQRRDASPHMHRPRCATAPRHTCVPQVCRGAPDRTDGSPPPRNKRWVDCRSRRRHRRPPCGDPAESGNCARDHAARARGPLYRPPRGADGARGASRGDEAPALARVVVVGGGSGSETRAGGDERRRSAHCRRLRPAVGRAAAGPQRVRARAGDDVDGLCGGAAERLRGGRDLRAAAAREAVQNVSKQVYNFQAAIERGVHGRSGGFRRLGAGLRHNVGHVPSDVHSPTMRLLRTLLALCCFAAAALADKVHPHHAPPRA